MEGLRITLRTLAGRRLLAMLPAVAMVPAQVRIRTRTASSRGVVGIDPSSSE